jgi:predicted small metal-binding protein
MDRMYADCWDLPSEGHCHTVFEADGERELLEATAKHATEVHGHKDGPELCNALRETFHHGAPTSH